MQWDKEGSPFEWNGVSGGESITGSLMRFDGGKAGPNVILQWFPNPLSLLHLNVFFAVLQFTLITPLFGELWNLGEVEEEEKAEEEKEEE